MIFAILLQIGIRFSAKGLDPLAENIKISFLKSSFHR